MRLKFVFISDYKNLKNFTLDFDGENFIDVFVGKNGSGKSNLFEALLEIFRHIFEFDKEKGDPGFEYTVKYEISGNETEIAWRRTSSASTARCASPLARRRCQTMC